LQGLDDEEDWKLVQLYGDLDPLERQQLEHGGQVQLRSLTPEAQTLAHDIVFCENSATQWNPGVGTLSVDDSPQTTPEGEIADYDGDTPNDYRTDPTELIPNGLPGEATIQLALSEEPVLRPANVGALTDDQLRNMAGLTPEKLVNQAQQRRMEQANSDDSHAPPPVGPVHPEGYKQVQVGIHKTLHFRIYVSKEAFRSSRFMVPSFTSDTLYTLKTLPPEMQKTYDECVEGTVMDVDNSELPAWLRGGSTTPP
jgi:hypothetical protein